MKEGRGSRPLDDCLALGFGFNLKQPPPSLRKCAPQIEEWDENDQPPPFHGSSLSNFPLDFYGFYRHIKRKGHQNPNDMLV